MTEQTSTPQMPTPLAVPWTPPAQAHTPQAPQSPQAFQPQPQTPAAQSYHPATQHAPAGLAPQQAHRLQPAFQQPQQAHDLHGHGQYQPQRAATPGYRPMPQPAAAVVQEKTKSKSLLAGVLKRDPKAATAEGQTPPAQSRSLFDKNFIFGLAAGLILGFLVLPMVFGGSPEPAYSPVAETAAAPVAALEITEGESFVDAALAEEVP